ncbi:hemophilus-specific protein [Mannheimia haemolytica]|nr:hemophilus-specific protein [Mannheimia haemolytica]
MKSDTTKPKMTRVITVLKITLMIIGIILLLLVVGWLAMTYFPSTNFQAWFYETRYAWLGWRFVLYVAIWLLMVQLNRKGQMPLKARLMILSVIPIIEGLNLLYLLAFGSYYTLCLTENLALRDELFYAEFTIQVQQKKKYSSTRI